LASRENANIRSVRVLSKMMYSTLLLMCLCLVGLASGQSVDRAVAGQYVRPSELDLNKAMECYEEMRFCKQPLYKYLGRRGTNSEIMHEIHQAGAKTVCSDALNLVDCLSQKTQIPECEGLNPAVINMDEIKYFVSKWRDLYNQVCVDRINDLTRNWECLLGNNGRRNRRKCQRPTNKYQVHRCDMAPSTNCIADYVSGNKLECQPGATDFIREFQPKLQALQARCTDEEIVEHNNTAIHVPGGKDLSSEFEG